MQTCHATLDDTTPEKKKMVDKPTIEFVDFPAHPNPQFKYEYTITVEVEDFKEKLEIKIGCSAPCCATGHTTQLKASLENELDKRGTWKISYIGDWSAMTIEGFTDAKTKKFHRVKSIKFESSNVPKEYWPTITIPRNRG